MEGYKAKDFAIIIGAVIVIVYAIETFSKKAAAQKPPLLKKMVEILL
jgi:hypothetical protein